jgi:hypothetical protein
MSEATLQLHTKLYPHAAVKAAAEAYADVCQVTVGKAGSYWQIALREVPPDLQAVVAHEFANYALAEAVERGR